MNAQTVSMVHFPGGLVATMLGIDRFWLPSPREEHLTAHKERLGRFGGQAWEAWGHDRRRHSIRQRPEYIDGKFQTETLPVSIEPFHAGRDRLNPYSCHAFKRADYVRH